MGGQERGTESQSGAQIWGLGFSLGGPRGMAQRGARLGPKGGSQGWGTLGAHRGGRMGAHSLGPWVARLGTGRPKGGSGRAPNGGAQGGTRGSNGGLVGAPGGALVGAQGLGKGDPRGPKVVASVCSQGGYSCWHKGRGHRVGQVGPNGGPIGGLGVGPRGIQKL
jgi:hypothetical protein